MLDSGLPEQVEDGEVLARFVVQSGLFRPSTQEAKPGLFLPYPHDRGTSVSRVRGLAREAIAEIGRRDVVGTRAVSLYGWATLAAKTVRDQGLSPDADEPPPRHALIRNWPWPEDPELRKARHLAIAQQLAASSTLELIA